MPKTNFSKSTRVFLKNESSSTFKIKSLLNLDATNTFTRPVTAGSCLFSSRMQPIQKLLPEIEGLPSEDLQKVYCAKCIDLDIAYIKDQELRFLNFCSKTFCNRTIGLNENGLGEESIKILSAIIKKNTFFCRIYLSKNNIGDSGAILLASTLKSNKYIVMIDLSSNDISAEGCSKFFQQLHNNESLVSINISSLEGLRRNRLGPRGAEALGELLKVNRTLTHINIADTGIGKEGLEYISQGIAHNQVLVGLDLGYNGFGYAGLGDFCGVLATTRLQELAVAGNKIGGKGCEVIAKMLMNHCPLCTLCKLDVAMCEISCHGICCIFEALENNPTVTVLNADNNPIGQYAGSSIGKCFGINGTLNHVSLNACNLKDEGVIRIAEGVCRNIRLRRINLCKNMVSDASAKHIADLISCNKSLTTLDLSYNCIKSKGGIMIVNSLKNNSTLENLLLIENSLKDESGRILAEVTRYKNNLLKIELGMNPINLKYIKEIKDNLQKNILNYKQLLSPRIRKEIEKLTLTDRDINGVFEKIHSKAQEKIDYQEKIVRQKAKLENTISEESLKLNTVKTELIEAKDQSSLLSKKLEDILYELTRIKFATDKDSKERSDEIAFMALEIQRLKKQSNIYVEDTMKEVFGMKRSQINGVIDGLRNSKKDADIGLGSAKNSLDMAKSKIHAMILEIEKIKNPRKRTEETKKKEPKQVRKSTSQRKLSPNRRKPTTKPKTKFVV